MRIYKPVAFVEVQNFIKIPRRNDSDLTKKKKGETIIKRSRRK